MIKTSRIRLVATTFLILSLLFASPLAAQDSTPDPLTTQISVRPKDSPDGTRFEATVEPGETFDFTAFLENQGQTSLKLRTYVANVLPTINGGLNIDAPDADPVGVTSWITYATEELTLNPGEATERPMHVEVPDGTPPGQYVSAVALETVDPVQESAVFNQYFRKIITIYITVPGDVVTSFDLGSPEIVHNSGVAFIVVPLENTGNVRLELEVTYQLDSSSGQVVTSGSTRLGVIYMGQSTFVALPLQVIPEPGEYSLTFDAKDSSSGVTQALADTEVIAPEIVEEIASPLTIESVAVEANADPIVFANISVTISTLQAYQATRLTISVYHDGAFVEDFVLADNLSLAIDAPTTVTQRYLPLEAWESGTYTFSLKLESTAGGNTTLLLEEADVASLEVP